MFKGSVYIFLLMVAGELVGLLSVIAATHFLGVESTGFLIFLQNNLFLFGAIGTLGLGTTMYKFLPRYLEDGAFDKAMGLIIWAMGIAVIAAALSATVFWVVQASSPKIDMSLWQKMVFSLCILAWSMVTIDRQMLRALGVIFWSDFSYQIIRPLGTLVLLLAGIFVAPPEVAILAALLLPLLLCLVHDAWQVRRAVTFSGETRRASKEERSAWWNSSKHFTLVMLSRVVLQRLDILVVGALLGLQEAAIYGVVARVSILAAMVVEPVQSMFQPRVSRHFSKGNIDAVKMDTTRGSLWMLAASLGVALVLLVAPGFWLQVFGDVYKPGTSELLLVVMIVGRLFAANSSSAQSLALMSGHERQQSLVLSSLTFGLYPPILLLGTWWGGMFGAALATALVRVIQAIVKFWLSYRNTGIVGVAAPTPTNLGIAFAPIFNSVMKRMR